MAVALLSDSERGAPVYLAICNLFVCLIYLFHLSALNHPDMPAVGSRFPLLTTINGNSWDAGQYSRRDNCAGLLLVFLRGSFCADSRAMLARLPELLPELRKRGIELLLFSTEPPTLWPAHLRERLSVNMFQLSAGAAANTPFIARGGAPLLSQHTAALRPSQWLLDREGFVLWRHLPANYRTPGDAALMRGQLFRLEE
ncbi:hypothetical protein [Microbulbifer taiwanensis]|uniref:Redoxin domain-containing protein n=1 Tax=Microbulbifer taiwanensis TaxID=986746 RepID=A0ABW1YPF6_9GAMM|nr:hypothetical protein [Microbulbifer taiwanensis]